MIPRVLHQLWIGGPVPDEYAGYRARLVEMHPEWEHHLWTEANMPPLVNQALWDAAPDIVPDSVEQFRSDLARYELLLVYGGVWLDMDMEPLRALDPLLGAADCWFCYEDTAQRWVNNAAIGAVPGHKFLDRLVRGLEAHVAINQGKGWRPNKLSGPQYVTPEWSAWKERVRVLPSRTFYPYSWAQVGTAAERGPWHADTFAVHRWHNTRKRGGPRRRRRTQVGSQRARG